MSIEYTTTTVDSPEYKRLICGRTDDITKLLSYVNKGDSIALFGERRIGKTSLLYLLRDIINQDITTYKAKLIDADLNNAIANLQARSSDFIAVYVNLQELSQLNIEAFSKLIYRQFTNNTLINSLVDSRYFLANPPLTETFQEINRNFTSGNKRLVILIDEIENLLENEEKLAEGKQVFNNLKSIIQSCPNIRFVFAGAEEWHKQIKYKTSPIAANTTTFYLKLPSRYAIENYLIKHLLSRYIPTSPRNDLEIAIKTILELTDAKPLYVQAVSQVLIEIYQKNRQFSPESQKEIIKEVEESLEGTLDYFYENDNLDIVSKKTLVLLANESGITVKQIAAKLGSSVQEIYDTVSDLESLDQIRKEGSEYYIVGKLIENWGKKTQNVQTINPWTQRLKWISVGILVLLIPTGYIYTNPELATFTCSFTDGKLEIEIPKSMELDENGEVTIKIKNTSAAVIELLTVILESEEIEYQHSKNSSSLLELKNIRAKETKHEKMSFSSASEISDRIFSSQVTVQKNKSVNNNSCSFDVAQRRLPIKTYWWIINPLLLLVSGFITKKDLLPIFLSLISQLSSPGKSEIKS